MNQIFSYPRYAEAAALAEKQELTAGEAAEMSQLCRKLVKLFHPDRSTRRELRSEWQILGSRLIGSGKTDIFQNPADTPAQ